MSKMIDVGMDVALAFGATFTYGLVIIAFLNVVNR